MNDNENPKYLVIPPDRLGEEVLESLIDEFVLREGTDYGSVEYTLEQKREHVMRQLTSERVSIVYDIALESSTILKKEEIPT